MYDAATGKKIRVCMGPFVCCVGRCLWIAVSWETGQQEGGGVYLCVCATETIKEVLRIAVKTQQNHMYSKSKCISKKCVMMTQLFHLTRGSTLHVRENKHVGAWIVVRKRLWEHHLRL